MSASPLSWHVDSHSLAADCPGQYHLLGHEPLVKSMAARRDASELSPPKQAERIAKVIARAGLCSRRDAERWIAAGRVSVNGKVLESPAFTVGPADKILVDGRPLPVAEAPRLFLYHKPVG